MADSKVKGIFLFLSLYFSDFDFENSPDERAYDSNTPTQASAVVKFAIEKGYRHIDAALIYGRKLLTSSHIKILQNLIANHILQATRKKLARA